jgi:hypothetical protein
MLHANLIIIHRGGQYARDFAEIGGKIVARDPGIAVFCIDQHTRRVMGDEAWRRPSLTVALLARFEADIRRGPVLMNRAIHKTGQHRIFTKAGIPTPPTLRFVPGMKLDPIMFGEFVVIKPTNPRIASYGRGIQLFRRRKLETMRLRDFPRDHLIHQDRDGYIVQRLIDTGPLLKMHRVQTLFGVPLYCWAAQNHEPLAPIGGTDEDIERVMIASNAGQERVRWLCVDSEALALSARVGEAFPHVPILGMDIVRDEKTGKIYVLECNPGGNTWHFSSEAVISIRQQFGGGDEAAGRQKMIDQLGAFDLAAEVLVKKVRELAA